MGIIASASTAVITVFDTVTVVAEGTKAFAEAYKSIGETAKEAAGAYADEQRRSREALAAAGIHLPS